jgi:hypothetical protein
MVWLGCLSNKIWVCKKKIFAGRWLIYIAGMLSRALIYEILFEKAPMTVEPQNLRAIV